MQQRTSIPYVCKHFDKLEDQHRYMELYSIIHETATEVRGDGLMYLRKFCLDHLWFHAVVLDGRGTTEGARELVMALARKIAPELVVDPTQVIRRIPKVPEIS